MSKEEVEELRHLFFGRTGYKPRYEEWELEKMRKMAYACGARVIPPRFIHDMPSFVWDDAAFEKFDHLTRTVEFRTNKRRLLLTR